MDSIMLNILIEEARKGNKSSNTFKNVSYVRAAEEINNALNIGCKSTHVENCLKTVKKLWNIITTLKNKSGFGWDDSTKMITVDKDSFYEKVKAHPTYANWFNKKIDMYDEMAIVVGKDMATESFAKSFPDFELDEINSVEFLNQEDEEEEVGMSTSSRCQPSSSSKSKRKRNQTSIGEDLEKISEKLDVLSKAVESVGESFRQSPMDLKQLYNEVIKMEDERFDADFLDEAFDYLEKNLDDAKLYMVKRDLAKKKWLQKFQSGSIETASSVSFVIVLF